MQVRFTKVGGDDVKEDVKHISVKSQGDVVLRYSDRKETVRSGEYIMFTCSNP